MPDNNITLNPCRQRIRFKFMPTPTGPLHIGHAWLLILMHQLVKQANQVGRQADVVLVLDELTGRHGNREQQLQIIDDMIDDVSWLGIEFSQVVSNYWFPYESDKQASPMKTLPCGLCAPSSLYPPHLNLTHSGYSYYLKNSIIDAVLEVTHIIRGADQLGRVSIYQTLYEMLEMPAPILLYIPFVCRPDGSKITATGEYTLKAVRQHLSPDQLKVRLIQNCFRNNPGVPTEEMTIEKAEQLFLGDDWEWILGSAESQPKLRSFLARMAASPVIAQEEVTSSNELTTATDTAG